MTQFGYFILGMTAALPVMVFVEWAVPKVVARFRGERCLSSPSGRGHRYNTHITRGKDVCIWCGKPRNERSHS